MKNMKQILTITALALVTSCVFAQDDEIKNVRFGLKVTPSVNWLKAENTKLQAGNGPAVKIGGGVILEFRLAKVASIQTGLQIDMDGGKVKYTNDGTNQVSYFYNTLDEKIVEYNTQYANSPDYIHYQLNQRTYSITYVTLPIALKLKTKEIGSLTYFGQVGMNTSVRWKAKANDNLSNLQTPEKVIEDKSKIDITKDVSPINLSLNFGLGAEYNLSGTTSILFGLNYNFGFTNAVKGDSKYLERRITNSVGADTYSNYPQSLKTNAITLTVGILF
jgi:hypothetical protein